MPHYRLSRAAVADIAHLLDRSEEQFGVAAQERYEELIRHAIGDIVAEPLRRGSTERPELGPGVRSCTSGRAATDPEVAWSAIGGTC